MSLVIESPELEHHPKAPEPSSKWFTIWLAVCSVILVLSVIGAAYYRETTHSDTVDCKNQVYVLGVVNDLAQTARFLVQSDRGLDQAVRDAFIKRYDARHREIDLKIAQSGCATKLDLKRR